MMKRLAVAVVALVTMLGVTVINAGNASAWGNEWLGCRVGPGSDPNFYEYCQNNQATVNEYNVLFLVQNETASSTYSWSVPPGYQYSGCTSADNWCTVDTSPGQQDLSVSVTLTQGGNSNYLTAYAHIEPFCGSDYC